MKESILQMPRLNGKILTEQNQNYVFDLYNKSHSIKFLQGVDAMQDIKLAKDCGESYHGISSYLIFENSSNDFVGFGGIHNQEPMADGSLVIDNDIEFLIILDAKFNGLGYASEFCRGFFDRFFQTFPQKTLPARVHKENISCIKLLEKFGFNLRGEIDYHQYGNKYLLLENNFSSWQKLLNCN